MRAEKLLWWFAVSCSLFVVLGSLTPRTTRVYGEPGKQPFTIATEAGTRWQVWTFLLGAVAFTALATGLGRHPRAPWITGAGALVAAIAFGLVAARAGQHWIRLLEERGRPREYVLDIAAGLPFVTIAAVVGTASALAIAIDRLWSGDGKP